MDSRSLISCRGKGGPTSSRSQPTVAPHSNPYHSSPPPSVIPSCPPPSEATSAQPPFVGKVSPPSAAHQSPPAENMASPLAVSMVNPLTEAHVLLGVLVIYEVEPCKPVGTRWARHAESIRAGFRPLFVFTNRAQVGLRLI